MSTNDLNPFEPQEIDLSTSPFAPTGDEVTSPFASAGTEVVNPFNPTDGISAGTVIVNPIDKGEADDNIFINSDNNGVSEDIADNSGIANNVPNPFDAQAIQSDNATNPFDVWANEEVNTENSNSTEIAVSNPFTEQTGVQETKSDIENPFATSTTQADVKAVDVKGRETVKKIFGVSIYVFIAVIIATVAFLIALVVGHGGKVDKDTLNKIADDLEPATTLGEVVSEVLMDTTTAPEEETSVITTTEPIVVTESEVTYFPSDRLYWDKGVVGEIYIADTMVHDLVVQGKDNDYYLDKGLNGEYYESGELFLDYRNTAREFDRNNIIYGHNMKDGTRFGTLSKLRSDEYYIFNNPDCYLYYNGLDYDNRFKIYSVYEIDLTTFNYIQTGFESDDEFSEFLTMTKIYNEVPYLTDIQGDVQDTSKILTLSTCTQGGDYRLVVHAYLTDSKPAEIW